MCLGKICYKLIQKVKQPFEDASSVLKTILQFFEIPNYVKQVSEQQVK